MNPGISPFKSFEGFTTTEFNQGARNKTKALQSRRNAGSISRSSDSINVVSLLS